MGTSRSTPFRPALVSLAALGASLAACGGEEGATSHPPALLHEAIVDGQPLRWRSAGPESGMPLVLLHGARSSSHIWEALGTLAYFEERGQRVVALDLPGYGGTPERPDRDADWLAAWLAHVGAESCILLAPSMAGCYAFRMLEDHPEGVAALVLVAPRCVQDYEGTAQPPTLVVWGAEDDYHPVSYAERASEVMGGAEVVLIEGAGHDCYTDDPGAFHARVWEFVRSLPGG